MASNSIAEKLIKGISLAAVVTTTLGLIVQCKSEDEQIKEQEKAYRHRQERLLNDARSKINELSDALKSCSNVSSISPSLTNNNEVAEGFLKQKGITKEELLSKLSQTKDIIPAKGVLGGTMRITNPKVLNKKWIHAQFEDGHKMGEMIVEYTIENKNKINWKVVDFLVY